MRIVTIDDIIDVYQKMIQRGFGFIFSKINPNGLSRIKSAFSNSSVQSSNWWGIPQVKERWNERITSRKEVTYEKYTVEKHLKTKSNLSLLSIGSGVCSHEIAFAQYSNFGKVVCLDIAENSLKKAQATAQDLGLKNMEFLTADMRKKDFEKNTFDIVLFHSSLHHFSNIEQLMSEKITKWLNPDGLLIINEYVGKNRLQFDRKQIQAINEGLRIIPNRLKRRYKTNFVKKRYYGSGYLRMIIADPSECIESANIIPSIRKHFTTIEEKPYGGNLIMNILKDISHNFVDTNDLEAQEVLQKLFLFEDEYLKNNKSDFLYGIYKKI